MRRLAQCVWLAAMVVPGGLFGAGRTIVIGAGTPKQRTELRDLGREVVSLQLVAKLKLSPSQRQALYPVVEQAAAAAADYERRQAELLPPRLEAYAAFKAEDEKDQGFTPEVERRTARLHHQELELRGEYMKRVGPLEDQVRKILTPEQLAQVETYDPRAEARAAGGAGSRGKHNGRRHALAQRVRGMSDAEFRKQLPRLTQEHLRRIESMSGRRLSSRQRRAQTDRFASMLRRLRQSKSGATGRAATPPGPSRRGARHNGPQAQSLRSELQQRTRGTPFARLSRVGRFLLHPGVLAMLRPSARTQRPDPLSIRMAVADSHEKLDQIRADINLLNLVNGLNLTSKQVGTIRSAAQQAGPTPGPRSAEQDLSARQLGEKIRALRSAKSDLLSRGEVSGSTRDALRRAMRPRRTKRPRGSSDLRRSLTDTVYNVLTDAQREVLADYKPCLIPPKDLKNPVRAGQASDSSRMQKMLTRLRNVPPDRVPFAVDRIMEGEQKHLGKLTPEERQRRKAQLLEVLDAAQQMSDADYEIEKDELAAQVEPIHVREELMKQLTSLGGKDPVKRKVEQFLLDPDIVPILRKRQQLLATNASRG